MIEKVTRLEEGIQVHQNKNSELTQKLRQKQYENQQLEEQVEEMTKRIDSVAAENAELK